MGERRRRHGFERAGIFPGESLPFPVRRRRELGLALAWRSVAGAAVAARAPARGIRAGTLVVETGERRWAETLRELLPELGRRFARRYPERGVRRCRLVLRDDAGQASETIPLAAEGEGEPAGPARPTGRSSDAVAQASAPVRTSNEAIRRRLEELGARLLDRAALRQKP